MSFPEAKARLLQRYVPPLSIACGPSLPFGACSSIVQNLQTTSYRPFQWTCLQVGILEVGYDLQLSSCRLFWQSLLQYKLS